MVVFYTTHCPKCKVIKTKLDKKGVTYTENENVNEMLELGFKSAPILIVDGKALTFNEALKWVGEQ